MPRLASIVLTAALLAAGGVAAQAPPPRDAAPVAGGHLIPAMVRGEQLKPPGSFYVGGYASAHGGVAATVHLYEHRQGAETEVPVWRPWALREVGRGTALRVEWADGDTCPAVHGVRQMLADRFAPRFRPSRSAGQLPAGGRTPPGPPIVLDGGSTVAVWGYAVHPDGAMGAMIFTGREGALLDWAAFANAQLDGCWSATPPPFVQPVAAAGASDGDE